MVAKSGGKMVPNGSQKRWQPLAERCGKAVADGDQTVANGREWRGNGGDTVVNGGETASKWLPTAVAKADDNRSQTAIKSGSRTVTTGGHGGKTVVKSGGNAVAKRWQTVSNRCPSGLKHCGQNGGKRQRNGDKAVSQMVANDSTTTVRKTVTGGGEWWEAIAPRWQKTVANGDKRRCRFRFRFRFRFNYGFGFILFRFVSVSVSVCSASFRFD